MTTNLELPPSRMNATGLDQPVKKFATANFFLKPSRKAEEAERKLQTIETTIRTILRQTAQEKMSNQKLEFWSKVPGLLVFVIGGLVLLGWCLEIAALRQFLGALVAMKANTALALLLAGVAAWMLWVRPGEHSTSLGPSRRRLLAAGYALIVTLIGLATLAEHVGGWDLGIDRLVFLPPAMRFGSFQPGRMEMEIAANFVFIGIALLLLVGGRHQRIVDLLIYVVASLSVLSLIGLFRGIRIEATATASAPMAIVTVLAFLLQCVGLFLASRQR